MSTASDYFMSPIFRIRQIYNPSTGVPEAANIVVCCTNLTIEPGLQFEELPLSCERGMSTGVFANNPDWSIEIVPRAGTIAGLNAALRPGTTISFEVIKNPYTDHLWTAATPANALIIEVVQKTLVTTRPDTLPGKGLGKRTITGKTGNYFPEQVGRTNLPAPFNADPS
jgi:hypothetical protein